MKVFIQQCHTGLYLNPDQQWVRPETEALQFDSSTQAVDFCVQQNIKDAEVIIRFGYDARFDIRFPVKTP